MAYSMALNTVYNQYLTTYAPKKSDTKYDTHKKSELRSITNTMAQVNKDAPLYKIENNEAMREYVVGLKEESRALQNTIASVIGNRADAQLDGKVAYSTDENVVSAKYVGTDEDSSKLPVNEGEDGGVTAAGGEVPTYDIEVKSLASAQVNLGKYLPKSGLGIEPGDYVFDLTVNGQGYEFQYSIRQDDTNFDVQNRLSRLINNSGIHLSSTVEEDGEGNASLRIESEQIGIRFGQNTHVFEISDSSGDKSGSVDYLGIDYVAREASNAHLVVNGMETEASSNMLVLDKTYEITLNGVSREEGVTTTIGVKPNTEAAAENISNIVGGINQFIKTVSEFKEAQSRANGLLSEIGTIADTYRDGMEKMGISFTEDGTIDIDREKLSSSIADETAVNGMSSLKGFTDAMLRKSKQVSVNPINYVNKTIVEYKNPGRTFLSPYVASAYAGMMFNSYC